MTNGMAENMTEFTVKLADIPGEYPAIYPRMHRFLRDYLTGREKRPAFTMHESDHESISNGTGNERPKPGCRGKTADQVQ